MTSSQIDKMYAIYMAHYDACDRGRFESDLRAKHYVILLLSELGIVGFSTVAIDRFESRSGPVQVLFSGDTIIDRSSWGDQALSRCFARLAGALSVSEPGLSLYWLLISKGHRTYRYLSLFSRRYFPHPDGGDESLRDLANEIAVHRFGEHFDPRTGVIAFPESRGHLMEDIAEVPQRIATRPEGAFFLQRNPGYRKGDELVCLTQLSSENLRAGVRSAFEQGMRDGMV